MTTVHAGHYTQGLEGCPRGVRLELRGAFDSLYAYLSEDLSSSSGSGSDVSMQLDIINCLGIRISEDDHTLLSRVNVFYTLEEIIESALAASVEDNHTTSFTTSNTVSNTASFSTSFTTSLSPQQPTPLLDYLQPTSTLSPTLPSTLALSPTLSPTLPLSVPSSTTFFPLPLPLPQLTNTRSLQLVTKAAMKLFIYLSLQVATSGEREMSYIVSKLSAITLKRARSGPGTLSKAVFDILYSQLVGEYYCRILFCKIKAVYQLFISSYIIQFNAIF